MNNAVLERVMRETMYANAYGEAVSEFRIVTAWRKFRDDPTARITIRRAKRQEDQSA